MSVEDFVTPQPTDAERSAATTLLRMIWGTHISRAVYVAAEAGHRRPSRRWATQLE